MKRLWQANTLNDTFESLLGPWLESACNNFSTRPSAIVVAQEAHIVFIKQWLAHTERLFLGVHFWTPGVLRKMLLQHAGFPKTIALREDLHLALRQVLSRKKGTLSHMLFKYPELFVSTWDALQAAGWGAGAFEDLKVQEIGLEFESHLETMGICSIFQAEKWLQQEAKKTHIPLLSNVFFWGFSAQYSASKTLLEAAIQYAQSALMCLPAPSNYTQAEMLWIGSWEGYFKSEAAGIQSNHTPNQSLSELANLFLGIPRPEQELPAYENPPGWILEKTLHAQVKAIVDRVVRSLVGKRGPQQIGIVTANAQAPINQALLQHLKQAEIHYCDHVGLLPATSVAGNLLESWVNWQLDPTLPLFLYFLEQALASQCLERSHMQDLKQALENAARMTLTEQLTVLFAYIKAHFPAVELPWALLPHEAPWGVFCQLLIESFELLNAGNFLPIFKESMRVWMASEADCGAIFKKQAFLEWARAVTLKKQFHVMDSWSNPYACVHLLTLGQASGLYWDTLILAGLENPTWEGSPAADPLLLDVRKEALNRQVLEAGFQGEGHLQLKKGYTLLECSYERKSIREALLANCFQNIRLSLVVSASLQNAVVPAIGPFFETLFAYIFGQALSPEFFQAFVVPTSPEVKRKAERVAKPVSYPLTLSASQWERLLQVPKEVWQSAVLKLGLPNSWRYSLQGSLLAQGTWAHQLLEIPYSFELGMDVSSWEDHIEGRAQKLRTQVIQAYNSADLKAPLWWADTFTQAVHKAKKCAQNLLNACSGLVRVQSEYVLPENTWIVLPGGFKMPLKGRIDCLVNKKNGTAETLCVVDFKTSPQAKNLNFSGLQKGTGLQVALYALAQKSTELNVEFGYIKPNSHTFEFLDISILEDLALSPLWKCVMDYQCGQTEFNMGLEASDVRGQTLPMTAL